MNLAALTAAENASIRAFLTRHDDRLTGDVLDYGSGRQPYRDVIGRAGGSYHPYDRTDHPCSMATQDVGHERPLRLRTWDTIVCTQVVQFVPDVPELLNGFRVAIDDGALLLTYPTCWPEINDEDLHRFTKSGMDRLLRSAGFEVVAHELRGGFTLDGYSLPFGYGVVAT